MGIVVLLLLAWMVWVRVTAIRFFWYDPVFYLYTTSIGVFFLSRFYLSYIHRAPPDRGHEPTVSIVISARNEEDAIEEGVESCFAADYPAHKREVIVIDDGSTDGTARALARAKSRFPELKYFTQPPLGKRHGMSKGVREATGEIIVFVDSDVEIDRNALRKIVCGFEDPSLGAVSGFTGVKNGGKNVLTQMQEVRYHVGYELMKAPESVYGAVSCCPGALSAYRREYLLEVLDPWLNQKFLGLPATFGDDRSLTNFIMRKYRILYNPDAISLTLVPETWKRYMIQQCRWKKSWLRETLIAGSFIYKKHPVAALSFYITAVCSLVSPFMVLRVLWWKYMDETQILADYVTGLMLLGLSMALFCLWRRPSRYWYLSWLLVAIQVVIMGPQTYYAMATMRKNHWGTR
jgi:hyaluronan synthase